MQLSATVWPEVGYPEKDNPQKYGHGFTANNRLQRNNEENIDPPGLSNKAK